MNTYIIFNTTSGLITKVLETLDLTIVTANTDAGEDSVEYTGVDVFQPELFYITNPLTTKDITGKLTLTAVATWSTTSITADGVSTATLGAGLPNPTTLEFTAFPGQIGGIDNIVETSGSFSLNTTVAGDYVVKASAFPYLDYIQTITAS